MKVIFLKDVPKVGKRFEAKDVSDGYARNFLIPNKLVEIATKKSLSKLEMLRSLHAEKVKETEARLMKELENIKGKTITFAEKANEKGHLFAGIHVAELLPLISKELGLELHPEHIKLDKPIKELGEHQVEVHIQDKTAEITVVVEEAK
jgi:large subunit ribosomal protein L9